MVCEHAQTVVRLCRDSEVRLSCSRSVILARANTRLGVPGDEQRDGEDVGEQEVGSG